MFSIGIDIVEHSSIINKSDDFIKRVLSDLEYAYFSTISNKKRQIEYVASRFASKEAIFKAYKVGDKTFNYKDISISINISVIQLLKRGFVDDVMEIIRRFN